MSTRQPVDQQTPVSQFTIWVGLLGAAGAWALHLVYSYSLVPAACEAGMGPLMYLGIPVFLGLAAGAGYLSWRIFAISRNPESGATIDEVQAMQRLRFMALSGLAMTAFFFMVIIAQSVPIIVQDPCEAAGSIRI
jgi:hypothetical protein